jgi:hypothetical protein
MTDAANTQDYEAGYRAGLEDAFDRVNKKLKRIYTVAESEKIKALKEGDGERATILRATYNALTMFSAEVDLMESEAPKHRDGANK